MATHHPAPAREPLASVVLHELGGRLFLALWGGLALVGLCRAVGLTGWATTDAVVLLVAACSLGQRTLRAVAVAVTGWLVIDGFVEHRYGQLGADARLTELLVAVVALACLVSRLTDGDRR